jgi:3-hydroxyisobutyrate dehydrogenase-like beta-hydroxyacid dehydrogenase
VGVGVVGLGSMGAAMATHLLTWPGGLTVYDVRPEAMQPLVDHGAHAAASLTEVAQRATVISIVVLDDAQVRAVVTELLASVAPGTVIAIHSTIDVQTAVDLATMAGARGVFVVDAPVSGGPVGAAQAKLAVMVGGDRAAYETTKPIFSSWATLSVHLGPVGAGTRAKLARNLISFVSYTAVAEAQRLAEAAGIDLAKLAAVTRHSEAVIGGPSVIMLRNTTTPMAAADPLRPILENTARLGQKDLSLALALGDALHVDLPLTRLALARLGESLGVAGPFPTTPTADVETT